MNKINRTVAILTVFSAVVLIGAGCSGGPKNSENANAPTTNAPAETTATGTPTVTTSTESATNTNAPATTATKPKTAPASTVRSSFYVEVDDSGFYPTSGTAKKGSTVTVTFKARASNVIYNGLAVRSNKNDLGTIKGGTSKSVTFPADSNVTFSAFWPTGAYRGAWTLYVK
jgi:hypothetical protein